MAKHFIMNYFGHSTIDFDTADPAMLKEANDRFEALIKEGHIAATRKTGESDYTLIKTPGQQQDETLFRPQMVGG
jgi:hypothetical protein